MSMSTPSAAHDTTRGSVSAEDLQGAYVWSINSAIEDGRDALAGELVDNYRSELSSLFTKRVARTAA